MSTAVANTNNGKTYSIKEYLASPGMIAELGKAMPAHCKPERMARVALTALTRTPKLSSCTTESFFECLLSLSQWGLEPDGRRAHLIPYGNKCTLVIDYKGYVELAYRSGVVKNLHADVVREGDLFLYSMGHLKEHVPHFLRTDGNKPAAEGKIFAVYCLAELAGGTTKVEVMSHADVEKIRKRSKAGGSGPWVSDWEEMAKKTAFRRLSKWLPLSADIIEAFERDDDRPADIQPMANARVANIPGLESALRNLSQEPDETIIDEPQDEPGDLADDAARQERLDMVQGEIEQCTTAAEVDAIQSREFADARWSNLNRDMLKLWCDNQRGAMRKKGSKQGQLV